MAVLETINCGNYHPYWISGEKNPKFDMHSGRILSLKDEKNREHQAAIKYFTNSIPLHLNKIPINYWAQIAQINIKIAPYANFLIVPGSASNKWNPGLIAVLNKICNNDKRFELHHTALKRTTPIAKLSKGGNRQPDIHLRSIVFNPENLTSNIIVLVDDVSTTGNSMRACFDIIRSKLPNAVMFGLVLGKTSYA